MSAAKCKNAFTLIEVLAAVILVGLAIVSLLAAANAFTQANGTGMNLSTAEFLIEQIKGRTDLVDYDNLFTFDDADHSPPISCDGNDLTDFAAFTQQVTVESISDTNFNLALADNHPDSHFIKITVNILYNNEQITSLSWIRGEY